jgi:hypothetical protein
VTKLGARIPNSRWFGKMLLSCVAFCGCAYGQINNQEQELEVHNLPNLMAQSHDPSDVLLTSLDTILHDREVCCGKDSALLDSLAPADPRSLKDVADRLQGRHLLSDGRPIMVTTEYLAPNETSSGHMITMILNQHAAIMEWNSHLYVVHGLTYMWLSDGEGGEYTELLKFLLSDTRYSDSRREVSFIRGTDDADKVQGFLFVEFKPQ